MTVYSTLWQKHTFFIAWFCKSLCFLDSRIPRNAMLSAVLDQQMAASHHHCFCTLPCQCWGKHQRTFTQNSHQLISLSSSTQSSDYQYMCCKGWLQRLEINKCCFGLWTNEFTSGGCFHYSSQPRNSCRMEHFIRQHFTAEKLGLFLTSRLWRVKTGTADRLYSCLIPWILIWGTLLASY